MKRIVLLLRPAAFLCAVLMAVSLVGCGFIEIRYPDSETTAEPGTTAASGSSAATDAVTDPPHTVQYPDRRDQARDALAALPAIELSVRDLIIANSAAASEVIEPDAGDALNAARVERNKMACEKYGINLTVTRADDSELLAAFVNASSSGTYYADFAVIPASSAALYFNSGIAADLRRLPFYTVPTDTEKAEGAGIAGSACYFYCGAAVSDPDSRWALYFNRTLAGAGMSGELYRSALKNEFTWDKLFETVSAAQLADGTDALLCGGKENSYFAADIACAAVGVSFVSHTTGKTPTVNYDLEKLTAAEELIKRIAAVISAPGDGGDARFAEGRGLFLFGTLSDVRRIYDKNVEWGILPIPLASADAAYVSPAGEKSPVMVCTGGSARIELDGAALAALNAASGAWLDDAYADASLESCLRDNDSYLTLRTVLGAEVKFDFAYIYAGATDNLTRATYGAARNMLTEGKSLAAAVKAARSAADREMGRLF